MLTKSERKLIEKITDMLCPNVKKGSIKPKLQLIKGNKKRSE